MHFTKMHGLGNDYLYVFGEVPENIKDLSIKMSDRHFGAGSDGMIYISKSDIADFKMRIFNADGSEAKMCGNGIRCVGKYVYDKGYTDKTKLKVETLSGIKKLTLKVMGSSVDSVSVDMGQGVLQDNNANISFDINAFPANCIADDLSIKTDDKNITFNAMNVSMGNPHTVIFTEDADTIPLTVYGPAIEHHELFPDGVNVEFVEVISRNEIRMRVWERGSGITMACGTGACASAFASVKKNFCDYDTPIKVILDGGVLTITISEDNTVKMQGSATTVYEGEVKL